MRAISATPPAHEACRLTKALAVSTSRRPIAFSKATVVESKLNASLLTGGHKIRSRVLAGTFVRHILIVLQLKPLDLSIAKTINNVVVHHAEGLHVRIDDRGADEGEPAYFKILAEGIGFG
jgi:hypothetical protein